MSADEIFVLILIILCVGAVVSLGIRSRRQPKATRNPDADPTSADVASLKSTAAEAVPSLRTNRSKRRKR